MLVSILGVADVANGRLRFFKFSRGGKLVLFNIFPPYSLRWHSPTPLTSGEIVLSSILTHSKALFTSTKMKRIAPLRDFSGNPEYNFKRPRFVDAQVSNEIPDSQSTIAAEYTNDICSSNSDQGISPALLLP